MGTGKTTVGRLVAERMGFDFVDTDDMIALRHGAISDIFSSLGEDAFRGFERDVAAELGARHGLVISTGGHFMLDEANVAALSEARTFCLTAAPALIVERVMADSATRPLLAGGEPVQRVKELLAARRAGYAQFVQIPTDHCDPGGVADMVVQLYERNQHRRR
jgi:shikimate kinase